METEDDHQQEYSGMNDLRHLVNGARTTHFPPATATATATADLFPQQYDIIMFGRQVAEMIPRCLPDFPSTDSAAAAPAPAPAPLSGLEPDTSSGRWPRQETLTLLEIRSRLDPKFKEANQKGPLWDQVSRIMSEEHGYQRSGKKCREKFENLYKYYKKTKEGKAGRQDGKHYRFFRQLEALYGENNGNPASVPDTNVGSSSVPFQTPSQTNQQMFQSQKHCDSISLTNSTDSGTSSSDDDDRSTEGPKDNDSMEKRRKRRSWKVKIKDFIDSQMRKLVEKQEEWLDKLMKTLEQNEKETLLRQEEWRRQEAARLEREHKFWAKERAWVEARDGALMDALQKLTATVIKGQSPEDVMAAAIQNHSENQNEDGSEILNSTARGAEGWTESEIIRLLQLKAEMEKRFHQSGCLEEVTWEEIATKMACFGYERSALMFKEKWESIISNYPRNNANGESKKRKENSTSCFYFDNNDHRSSLYNQGSAYCDIDDQRQETERLHTNNGSSPSNSNVANAVPTESCFPFMMGEGGNLWEDYSLKVNKASQN